jgi:ATP-dependent RNA circularization protein (DNA/RNA ligase family)
MSSWHSYPSIFTLGHRAIKDIFLDSVIVEEKVDGSQISFGKFDGVLRIKSKGKELDINHPEKLFSIAVDIIKTLDLQDGWTYRGEYLKSPKHNALFYDRVPKNHIIIFDINIDEENYLPYLEKVREADRIGLEVVPLLKSS